MARKGQTKANAKPASKRKRAYNARPEQKKNRAARNKARRQAIKSGRVRKGDGKDIDHKRPLKNGGSNAKSNQRVVSASKNRSDGGKMGTKAQKAKAGRAGGKAKARNRRK